MANLTLPTPIKFFKILPFLQGYNSDLVEILQQGFSQGFRLHFEGTQASRQHNNLKSALQFPDIVSTKINKEIEAGRIAGPFTSVPFDTFIVSPLGIVPKKTLGEFRLIHHLSFPSGSSINDEISSEFSSVSYATIYDAVKLIKIAGKGCFLAKTDIKHAFRIIPISPKDYNLLGIKFDGLFYYDKCMPMGCSSSCKTFETFSSAINWIGIYKLGIQHLLHILDDFLFVAPSLSLCQQQLDIFLQFCHYVGIPIAPEKTVGACTTLTFAGIELDTILQEARLPLDKLDKGRALISHFLTRKKVTLKELQSLNGFLNFACSVVLPGRAFLRRLINLTMGITKSHHLLRLTREVKLDLHVWFEFFNTFNGRSFLLDDIWYDSVKLNLYTDASGKLGFGAIFGDKWCFGSWPDSWKGRNIAFLEFYPIVLSLYLWAPKMKNQCILFFTDNEALVFCINKQTCKDKDLMFFVRKLVLICLQYNILFKAKHIPGIHNFLADALSRQQVDRFQACAPPYMCKNPTTIPANLLPQNLVLS